jgi:hypothetical protein
MAAMQRQKRKVPQGLHIKFDDFHIPSLTGRRLRGWACVFYQHSIPDGTGCGATTSRPSHKPHSYLIQKKQKAIV